MREENQYVTFEIDKQAYAIEISLVQEIIKTPEERSISMIGTGEGSGVGVIDLRGEDVVPVIDLRKAIGKPHASLDGTNTIICNIEDGKVGLVVDGMRSVQRHSPEEMDGGILDENACAILKSEDELIVVIDPVGVVKRESKRCEDG